MRARAVDVDFGEKREIHAKIDLASLLDLGVVAGFLLSELIAREAKNSKSLIFVCVMKLLKTCELGGEPAFRSGIDD